MSWSPWPVLFVTAGLVAPGTPGAAQGPDQRVTTDLPPAGYGSLRQDHLAVSLRGPTFLVRMLPLHEGIIRLLAPDAYESLHRLVESRRGEIEAAARRNGVINPALFLITAFGLEKDAAFDPEGLTITSRNRFFRPLAILPLSAQWNQYRLKPRETARAIFLYDGTFPILEPFEVAYGGVVSDQWDTTLGLVERERARVEARAGSNPRDR